MATLLIATSDGAVVRRIPLDPRMAYSLGRSKRCSIPLEPKSISRRHGLLFRHSGTWWLADCGSTRGLRTEEGVARFAPLTPERWIGIGPLVCWLIPSTVNVDALHGGTSVLAADAAGQDPLAGLDILDSVDLTGEHGAINDVPSDYLLLEPTHPERRAALPPRLIHLEGVGHATIGTDVACAIRLEQAEGVRPLHAVVYREPKTWVIVGAEGALLSQGQRFLRKRLDRLESVDFGGYSARLVALESVDPAHDGAPSKLGGPSKAPTDASPLAPDQRPAPTAADLYSGTGGSIFLQPSRSDRFKFSASDSVEKGSTPTPGAGTPPSRVRPTTGETPLL